MKEYKQADSDKEDSDGEALNRNRTKLFMRKHTSL